MKKVILSILMVLTINVVFAEEPMPEITFLKSSHDFGTFSAQNPVQKCTFLFVNTGKSPLYITQAIASCGCTVPTYTDKPIAPGDTGKIEVKYNGTGRYPGKFKKTITITSNTKQRYNRVFIEGIMAEKEENK